MGQPGGFGANGFGANSGRFGGAGGAGGAGDDQFQHRNFRTKACRFFQQGMCKNGDRCTFLHQKEGQGQGGGGGQPPAPQQQQRW